MQITRIGTQPSGKGPTDWFTGSVRIDPLFQPNGQFIRRFADGASPRVRRSLLSEWVVWGI